jgi:hypothetical protein
MNNKIKTVTKTQSEPDEPAQDSQNLAALENQPPPLHLPGHAIAPPVAIIPPMPQTQEAAQAAMMYN